MEGLQDENLYRKKLIKTKSGLRIVFVNEKYQSPFLLPEPQWVPDDKITHCMECRKKFNFTTRKHHCRRCGRIYCSSCCYSRVALPRMCFVDPVRVCEKCAEVTVQENDFFDKGLRILTAGAAFLLSPLSSTGTTCLCLCKLSQDHQNLQFDSVANLPPLPIDTVTNFSIAQDTDSGGLEDDSSGGGCVEILFENGGLRLTTGPETTKRLAMEWIEAIQQAFRLLDVAAPSNG